ncbi:MAG: hypothetical protein ACOC8N_07820 [Spirochaetota bacterium]
MYKTTYEKFVFLSLNNLRRHLLLNLLLLVPLGMFAFSLYQLIPRFVQLMEGLSVSVQEVHTSEERLAVVVVHGPGSGEGVYVYPRERFNQVRGSLFRSAGDREAAAGAREQALGYREGVVYGEPFIVPDRRGEPVLTLYVEGAQENAVEILFLEGERERGDLLPGFLSWVLLGSGFVLLFGSLGGVTDFTQRVVFHETRRFGYFFGAVKAHFLRSLLVSLFFLVVTAAILVNIYFYIFIISSDFSVFIAALNFWMLVFFLYILFWVFPLLVLNREENVWRIMRKSLFISFDNFTFTLRSLVLVVLLFLGSCCTLFIFPGVAGLFAFQNAAIKEISGRYNT